MRKFIFFLPFLSLLSGCHFSVNKSESVAACRSLCIQSGYKAGTREFDNCVKEQENRVKKQKNHE